LAWDEKVKTHAKGVVHFGIEDQEEMVLMPSSSLLLAKSDSGKRAVILRKGIVRVRQIALEQPNWSAIVDDWVQVDGDKKSDLIIERKNATQVTVTALRGNGRVFFRKRIDQPLNEGQVVVVPVGASVDIEQGYDATELRKPLFDTNDQIVRATSPQYFLSAKGGKAKLKGMFLSDNIKSHKNRDLVQAMAEGERYLHEEDFFRALEVLLPIYSKGESNYRFNVLIASSYRGLQLFRPALRFYRNAEKIDPNSGEPSFEIGLMYVDSQVWEKAELELLKARDAGYQHKQLVNYYLAVAQLNQGNKLAAKLAFEQSLWESPNREIKQSALEFLQKLGSEQLVGAIGTLGFGYDSNVYRWGDSKRTSGYETETGTFYRAFGSVHYQPTNRPEGSFKLALDVEKKGFTDSNLKDVETLSQKVYVDWKRNFGVNASHRSSVYLRLNPFIELFSYGDDRSADKYGIETTIGNETLIWAPKLVAGYTFMMDPLPGRNDKLDPLLAEPVQPSDRSALITWYGLGMRAVHNSSLTVGVDGTYKAVDRRSKALKADSFHEVQLNLPVNVTLTPAAKILVAPGYYSRKFPDSKNDRADSGYFTDLGFFYYYTPAFYNDLRAHYRKQNSNAENASYDQYFTSLNFTLEL
jgi:tetratricopeptide (TPR) repeat protein